MLHGIWCTPAKKHHQIVVQTTKTLYAMAPMRSLCPHPVRLPDGLKVANSVAQVLQALEVEHDLLLVRLDAPMPGL